MKTEFFTSRGEPARGLSFNAKGKAITNGTCDRCGGAGGMTNGAWMMFDPGGTPGNCFKCLGSGTVVMRAFNKKELAALERSRERAAERREEKRIAALEIRLAAEREKNGGLTNSELDDKIMAERKEEKTKISDALEEIWWSLRDGRMGFCDSISKDMENGEIPRGRGWDLVCEILAKKEGRKNSKAFKTEFERIEKILIEAKELCE